jgi:hypothetical protein
MLTTVCVAGLIGLGAGTFAAASADVFPTLRSRLSRWGSGILVASVAVLGFAIALI